MLKKRQSCTLIHIIYTCTPPALAFRAVLAAFFLIFLCTCTPPPLAFRAALVAVSLASAPAARASDIFYFVFVLRIK